MSSARRARPSAAIAPQADPVRAERRAALVFPALLLFASGSAALVFQVLWIKQLALIVGVDVYAVTIGVSAFFAGLAGGSFVFGRWADRSARPMRLYARIEVAIALLAVLSTYALAYAAALFARGEAIVGPLAWALPILLVGLPAGCMGGTLPVLTRAIADDHHGLAGTGGTLYAANTAGAIVGTLLAPFVLIPTFGVRGAALCAAALNVAVAAAAFVLDRSFSPRRVPSRAAATAPLPTDRALAFTLYALAGAIALGYEVVWTQVVVQFTSTRAFAFAVTLAVYLGGLFIGSVLYARLSDRIRDPWAVFGVLIAAAGTIAMLELAVLGRWIIMLQTMAERAVLQLWDSALAGMCARFAVAAACVVLVPTIVLGATLPLALRLTVAAGYVGRDVGRVLAFNTVGGIAGSVLAGFILVPLLGLVRTLAALALAAGAVGLVAVFRRGPATPALRAAVCALTGITFVAAVVTPRDRLARLLPATRDGGLVFHDESRGGTAAVVESKRGRNSFKRLYIQGVSNSGDAMPSLRYMRLQALLPLLIHSGQPRSALVIGLGTGITAGALLPYPDLEQRVVAELLPAVVRAAPLFAGNFGAVTDPRIEIRVRDGRRELLRSAETYDLITLEPPPPSAAGVVNLYATEFYHLAAARVRRSGIVAQWLPLATQNEPDTRSLIRSFLDVFPHASLWTTELHEMLLVGSVSPLDLDVPRIVQRFATPAVSAALGEVGIVSPAALLATWVADRAALERYAGDAPAVTDDRPRIEYAAWVRGDELGRTLPHLLQLQTPPPLVNADPEFVAAVAMQREQLLRFYDAGLSAYRGDRERWAQQMRRVIRDDPDNPYYRWFGGGA